MAITSNANWSDGPFTLDKMLDAIKRMPPRMDGFFGPSLFHDIMRSSEPRERSPLSFAGMPIVESHAFPMQIGCGKCDGTGEGEESTYCPKCKGAGENRYEGMVRNGDQTILLTVSLPKKFAPSFPKQLVAPPRLSRGLP